MIFVVGFVAGATVRPSLWPHAVSSIESAHAAVRGGAPMPAAGTVPQRLDPRFTYPADVLRVIDGDTFEARVRVWPGLDVDTKVRLRGVDAPELHARCADEYVKAQAARVVS